MGIHVYRLKHWPLRSGRTVVGLISDLWIRRTKDRFIRVRKVLGSQAHKLPQQCIILPFFLVDDGVTVTRHSVFKNKRKKNPFPVSCISAVNFYNLLNSNEMVQKSPNSSQLEVGLVFRTLFYCFKFALHITKVGKGWVSPQYVSHWPQFYWWRNR